MSVNQITIIGNVTRKPTLRYSPSGYAVTDLTVAENFRRRDQNGEWRDIAKTYYSVTCWRHLAEHVSQTLDKGHPVVVVGRLYLDEWVDRDGMLRKTPKVDPTSVGYDLRFSPVLAPVRASAGPDRDSEAARPPANGWERPQGDDEPEETEDPFDAGAVDDAVDDAAVRREVVAAPASEG